MARNNERDEREAERRRKQLLEAGFTLFSENGIDGVSLQTVAVRADVGVATMYKYFRTKVNLLVAISAKIWGDILHCGENVFDKEVVRNMNAYETVQLYAEQIIVLYQTRPELLRFSAEYKTYICRNDCSVDLVKEQLEVLKPLSDIFHEKYEMAKADRSIRTDIPEEELFTTIVLTMLGMAERYTKGVVWAMNENQDYTKELEHLKDMMLDWVKGKAS